MKRQQSVKIISNTFQHRLCPWAVRKLVTQVSKGMLSLVSTYIHIHHIASFDLSLRGASKLNPFAVPSINDVCSQAYVYTQLDEKTVLQFGPVWCYRDSTMSVWQAYDSNNQIVTVTTINSEGFKGYVHSRMKVQVSPGHSSFASASFVSLRLSTSSLPRPRVSWRNKSSSSRKQPGSTSTTCEIKRVNKVFNNPLFVSPSHLTVTKVIFQSLTCHLKNCCHV